ncbi:MAG: hypothetical protein M3487_09770 [Actinomycetota bacterium]|nr:hypothetical protein [Actinomycetota bacterium]
MAVQRDADRGGGDRVAVQGRHVTSAATTCASAARVAPAGWGLPLVSAELQLTARRPTP